MHDIERVRQYLVAIGYPSYRLGAFRTYVFRGPVVGLATPTPTDSPPVNVRFRRPVVALGIIGQVIRENNETSVINVDDIAYAQTELRLQFGSNEDAFDNGQGTGLFAPFLMLFGRFNKPMYDWTKPRFAQANIVYTATFRNTSTTDSITATAAVRTVEIEELGPYQPQQA